jgi:hypothetical protein
MVVMHHDNQKQAILAQGQELDHELSIVEMVLSTLEKPEMIRIPFQEMAEVHLVRLNKDTNELELAQGVEDYGEEMQFLIVEKSAMMEIKWMEMDEVYYENLSLFQNKC